MKAEVILQRHDSYQYRHFGGFRLALAALVMLQHFTADLAPEPLAIAIAPYPIGSMAVLAFFALSGFVITEAVDCIYRDRPGAFLGNRMLRILPHFLLAVALSMLAHALYNAVGGERLWRSQLSFPSYAFAPVNMALNFVGIVPLVDRFIDYNFLDITWAVRVEMAFYVVMGACIAIGQKLPGSRGFALLAGGVLVVLVPLFVLAINGKGPGMLVFLPYFAFGGGLYFATLGRRYGWLTVALSVPAMLWQCVTPRPPGPAPALAPLSLSGHLIIVALLLSILTILAFSKIARGRKTDRVLGSLTYPLYLYHEDVLVLVLTFTAGYSYGVFFAGILLSLLTAAALTALVDPLVTQYRDRLRGGALQHGELPLLPAADGGSSGAKSAIT